MKANYAKALPLVLRHEGGFVNHKDDPGGATNKGVTIGTLKRLGIDVDGDGDSDIVDLRNLRQSDVERVYRLFYWDAVKADQLPSGVDYAVFDFGVNSGPARAAKHLQKVVGAAQDGDIGPKTLALVARADPQDVVTALQDSRLRFLRGLKTWGTFGKGWGRRVAEVRAVGLAWAESGSHVRETPKTEHEALGMAGAKDVHTKHTPAEALKPPAQRVDPVPAPAPAPKANAPVALVVVAVFGAIAAAATGAWNWLLNLFN